MYCFVSLSLCEQLGHSLELIAPLPEAVDDACNRVAGRHTALVHHVQEYDRAGARLRQHMGANDLAVAKTGDQPHPVFALVRRSVAANLEAFLAGGGRKIDAWYASLKVIEVPFDDEADAFRNINTLEELGRA